MAKVDSFRITPSIRADNPVYRIDDFPFEGYIVSTTELHPFQNTKGHFHLHREFYLFLSCGIFPNTVLLMLGNDLFEVFEGDAFEIPPNIFHRVYNRADKPTKFLCVFRKP